MLVGPCSTYLVPNQINLYPSNELVSKVINCCRNWAEVEAHVCKIIPQSIFCRWCVNMLSETVKLQCYSVVKNIGPKELRCRLGARPLNTTHIWPRSTAPQPDGLDWESISEGATSRSGRRKPLNSYLLFHKIWAGLCCDSWFLFFALSLSFSCFASLCLHLCPDMLVVRCTLNYG